MFFLKPFTVTVFFLLSLFISSALFVADESAGGVTGQEPDTISSVSDENFPVDTLLYSSHTGFQRKSEIKLSEYAINQDLVSSLPDLSAVRTGKTENQIGFSIAENDLYRLERGMKLNVNKRVFPQLFLQYITACGQLKQEKRAIDFFHTLSDGTNEASPYTLTAKGVISCGWDAEKTLRDGLKKIDEAVSMDTEAFFPRLCRAAYLAYLPERFPEAIEQFYLLIEKEKHNRSHLDDIYKNLSRIYREHGHYAMAGNIDKKLQLLQDNRDNNSGPLHTGSPGQESERRCEEIARFPYPIIHNTTFTGKVSPAKDRDLDIHLSILEGYLERKHTDEIFSTMFARYVQLAWQYRETLRAVNFFETLAAHHPNSPNVLAAVGTITYGWRGQMLLQEGFNCVEKAAGLSNEDLFPKIHYAAFISYFPNGFERSMHEFSLLKQREQDSPKSVDMINSYMNSIRLDHGYEGNQMVECDTPGTRQWS